MAIDGFLKKLHTLSDAVGVSILLGLAFFGLFLGSLLFIGNLPVWARTIIVVLFPLSLLSCLIIALLKRPKETAYAITAIVVYFLLSALIKKGLKFF